MSGNERAHEGRATSDARTDRRVRRTRHALQHAMLELVLEKGYDRVTVADLIERADVGRSTFYAHFRDKEDLFLAGVEGAIREAFAAAPANDGSRSIWLFRHAGEHADLYRVLVRRRSGWSVVSRRIEATLIDVFAGELAASAPQVTIPAEAGARFAASALVGLLTWWLAEGCREEPDEIDAIFRTLVGRGLEGAFAVSV